MNLTQETSWTPIGNKTYFQGHFDGNGHTIYLDISRTGYWNDSSWTNQHIGGLFGWVSSSGYAIKNLNINATKISAPHSGGIVFRLDSGTVENCHFTGTINSAWYTGGIAGYLNGGTVKNCTVNGNVTALHGAGGIVGTMDSGSVEDCDVLSSSVITALVESSSDPAHAGGIVGTANIALDEAVKACTFNGTVYAEARTWNNNVYGNPNVYCGGIAGYLIGGTLQNNHVLPDAYIFSDHTAGGIAGMAASGSTLESNDTSVGARAQANGEALGGVVGLLNVGTVKGNTSYTALTGTATHQGGVIGKLEGTTATISGNKYNGAEHGIGFDASGFPSELGCERVGAAISITTSSPLPNATAGTSYSQAFATDSEESITWSHVSGDLPAGLTLNTSTGTLSGTPTRAGTFRFTLGAAAQYSSASKTFTLTVNLAITTESALPNATAGTQYSQTLSATGAAAITWTRTDGALPAGLTLSGNGTISGTPTTAGTSDFTVRADAGDNITATKAFRLTVDPAAAISITTTSLPSGKAGTSYNATLTAGVSDVTWSVSSGNLPSGLTLNSSTGAITGTPTTAGTSTFTIRADRGASSGTRSLTITIAPADPAISITTSTLPSGTVGRTYTAQLASSVSNASWSVSSGNLPSGLTLSSTGTISGTPTSSGTFSFTVRASSGTSSATKLLTITIEPATLTITTSSLPSGIVGSEYTYTLTASEPNAAWSVSSGSLPSGLTLSTNGTISGTLSWAGDYDFTITARTAYASSSKSFTISVTSDSWEWENEPVSSSGGGGCDLGLGILGLILSGMVLILRRP